MEEESGNTNDGEDGADDAALDRFERGEGGPSLTVISRGERKRRGDGLFSPPGAASSRIDGIPTVGALEVLVIPVRFLGHGRRRLPPVQALRTLFNSEGPDPRGAPTGSIRSHYGAMSYGKLDVRSTVVNAWTDVSEPQHGSPAAAFREALHKVHTTSYASRDVSNYHAVAFVHSSYPAEVGMTDCEGAASTDRVWAHAGYVDLGGRRVRYAAGSALWGTCGMEVARLGMLAHEYGHILGLPDLYDRSDGRVGSGIGIFDLMAYAWGADNSQRHPGHLSAWSKMQLGWIKPAVVTNEGLYRLRASSESPEAAVISEGYPRGEYLLAENRQTGGTDGLFSAGGLAIYHVDEGAPGQTMPGYPGQGGVGAGAGAGASWPRNGNHYRVALCQADRKFELERGRNLGSGSDLWRSDSPGGDLVPGDGRGTSYRQESHPNTDSYRGGTVRRTGISVHEIGDSGRTITFRISGSGLGPEVRKEDDNEGPVGRRRRYGGRGRRRRDGGNDRGGGGDGGETPPPPDPDPDPDPPGGCRDVESYTFKVRGRRVGCEYATSRPVTCRSRDIRADMFIWESCRASCRSYIQTRGGGADICSD